MPRLFVDADSMTARQRAVILRRAGAGNIETLFVADRSLPDVAEAVRLHTIALRAPLRAVLDRTGIRAVRSTISMVVVPTGDNSADDYIAAQCGKGDLVVSHDIPLLARVVEKGALAMDDRGNEYDEGNIRSRLGQRDVNVALREMGLFSERHRSMDTKVFQDFANTFDRLVSRVFSC